MHNFIVCNTLMVSLGQSYNLLSIIFYDTNKM